MVRIDRLDAPVEIGYYDNLIVVPERAYVPPELETQPAWGIAAQLYSLRSAHNDGIGDFGDLSQLASMAGQLGASTVALNPLHESA